MSIEDLIREGKEILEGIRNFKENGTSANEWAENCNGFLAQQFGSSNKRVEDFKNLAIPENIMMTYTFENLLGKLKAFKNFPPNPERPRNYELILQIMKNFDKFAIQIKRRREERDTIEITDEYDVQDAIHAIFKLFIDDIRLEEWTPSYAGGSSRMDFLLLDEKLVIETKMTRETLKDKQLGEELLIDIAKYAQHPDCNHLICFIYDKESLVHNPAGLKKDLEKKSSDQIWVTVIICPE